jgi:hypothetical protein
MKSNTRTIAERETLENFAAELTDAAYGVALRHGIVGSSVDLELDLWHVLANTVQQWGRQLPLCR